MIKIILAAILFSSCSTQQDLSKQAAKEISDADIAMTNLAIKDGFNKTLIQYSDDSVIKPADGSLPVIGTNTVAND